MSLLLFKRQKITKYRKKIFFIFIVSLCMYHWFWFQSLVDSLHQIVRIIHQPLTLDALLQPGWC